MHVTLPPPPFEHLYFMANKSLIALTLLICAISRHKTKSNDRESPRPFEIPPKTQSSTLIFLVVCIVTPVQDEDTQDST